MNAGSNPYSPVSHPALCLWPGKVVQFGPNPWEPTPGWETQKKLTASDFGSAQLTWDGGAGGEQGE